MTFDDFDPAEDAVAELSDRLASAFRPWAEALSKEQARSLLAYQGVAGYGDELIDALLDGTWTANTQMRADARNIDTALAASTVPSDITCLHGAGRLLHGDERWQPETWRNEPLRFACYLAAAVDPRVAWNTYGYQLLKPRIIGTVVFRFVVAAGTRAAYLPALRGSRHRREARYDSECEVLFPRNTFALVAERIDRAPRWYAHTGDEIEHVLVHAHLERL